ncbi:J domain-containing protein [Wolbachia endosymbiont (group A) of Sicus ferrugineus]|uniref:J domain-containing protein n=1 Tax=Wolbachia endosymbiont (group A) of Sicus ferrugineus TaxID=2954056 RepID=UPI002232BDBC|nr:J domain-containing protein [Wolbachia endosymbiont (group A) of Sicus ferrugineus]
MNRKEALEILGFSEGDNPSEREITVAYRKLALEYHPDKHSGASKDVQKQNEEKFKELGAVYNLFTGKDTEEVTKLTDENLDEINSRADLKFYLYEAISEGNTAFLKKLFSKFKSSKDEKFGDYINDNIYACPALMLSVLKGGNIKIIALFTIIRTEHNMLLSYHSHKHISYPIRTITRNAI